MIGLEWRDRAACDGRTEPDPTLPDIPERSRRRIAAWYCLECPVRLECAIDARERGDVDVIRGGLFLFRASTNQSRATKALLDQVIAEGSA